MRFQLALRERSLTGKIVIKLLPIMPEGCEHQHFNRHADKSCKWLAFIYKPMHDEVASYIEQKVSMPTGQA